MVHAVIPATPTESGTADPVIAVCETHQAAQALVEALDRAGFDMTKLSLVGKGDAAGEHAHGLLAIGDRVKAWGATGSIWAATWALLLGAAVVMMPPIGIVVAAGPIVATLLAVLEGAVVVGGVSAIAAALTRIGMPADRVAHYETHIKADRFLLIVHGTAADIARARAIVEDAPAA